MTIRPQSARSKQCGMNLFELIVFVVCVAIAANFSVYMASSHRWLVGVLAFPLGFCSAAYVISSLGEIAVRCGYRRAGRTPGILIRRSLLIGTICGVVMGGVFYCLGVLGIIPTVVHSAHRLFLSACLFGASVDFSFAFVWTLCRMNKKSQELARNYAGPDAKNLQ